MKIIIEKTIEDAAVTAANILLGKMLSHGRVNLAITAGKTPVRTYEILSGAVRNKPHFSRVHYYNFDEIPLKGKDGEDGITMLDLKRLFFNPAGIPACQIEALTGTNYQEHDKRIREAGGLDLIFMGIGADGHFCGNLPRLCRFDEQTVKTTVAENLKNRPDFAEILATVITQSGFSKDTANDYHVTMGPKSVMHAKEILMMATGKSKAAVVNKAFFGKITEDVPASVLQLHPNLTLLLDEDAAGELQNIPTAAKI